MPRDAVSRTANVERNGGREWVGEWDAGVHAMLFIFELHAFILHRQVL